MTSGSSLAEMANRDATPPVSVLVNLWEETQEGAYSPPSPLFTNKTVAIVWGMQPRAVQSMLDFDHLCSRAKPSVAAMVYPFR